MRIDSSASYPARLGKSAPAARKNKRASDASSDTSSAPLEVISRHSPSQTTFSTEGLSTVAAQALTCYTQIADFTPAPNPEVWEVVGVDLYI